MPCFLWWNEIAGSRPQGGPCMLFHNLNSSRISPRPFSSHLAFLLPLGIWRESVFFYTEQKWFVSLRKKLSLFFFYTGKFLYNAIPRVHFVCRKSEEGVENEHCGYIIVFTELLRRHSRRGTGPVRPLRHHLPEKLNKEPFNHYIWDSRKAFLYGFINIDHISHYKKGIYLPAYSGTNIGLHIT